MSVSEQLFAERGVDGVSLSEINRAAEQGNNSALHYHFGSKDGLFEAIREKHMKAIRAHAVQSFARLPDDPEPREVLAALVEPIAARLEDPDGGAYYLRILSQAIANPSQSVFSFSPRDSHESFRPFAPLLWNAAGHLPPAVRAQRLELMTSMLFVGLAAIAVDEQTVDSCKDDREMLVTGLVDTLTGIVLAPSSDAATPLP